MSKQKTKAELEELLKAAQKENSELRKENNRLKNGDNVLTYKYKFTLTECSRAYLNELISKTKFVREIFIEGDDTITNGQTREWKDGNRIIIVRKVPHPKNFQLGKAKEYLNLIKIEFYDVVKGIPFIEEFD